MLLAGLCECRKIVLLLADDGPCSNVVCFIRRYPEHAQIRGEIGRISSNRCLVEMLVNAGQEMDSTRDCKYKFSVNLLIRKPEYRPYRVNYHFGIQFILLLSIRGTLRHKWLSTRSLRMGFCLSVLTSLHLLLRRLRKLQKIRNQR